MVAPVLSFLVVLTLVVIDGSHVSEVDRHDIRNGYDIKSVIQQNGQDAFKAVEHVIDRKVQDRVIRSDHQDRQIGKSEDQFVQTGSCAPACPPSRFLTPSYSSVNNEH